MATENLLRKCIEAVNKRTEEELGHIQKPSREHLLKIVEEEIRDHFPVGNSPAFPSHGLDGNFGWDGEC